MFSRRLFGVLKSKSLVKIHGLFPSATITRQLSVSLGLPSRKRLIIGFGIFGVGLGAYEGYRSSQKQPEMDDDHFSAAAAGYLVPKSEVTSISISRTTTGPLKFPEITLSLYQYQSCPFCSKVRAFLDYYGVNYNIIEVDPVLRQRTKFSKYRKVPILLVNQKNDENYYLQLNDSSMIVSILTSYLRFNKKNENLYGLLKYYQNASDKKDKQNSMINKYFLMIGDAWTPKKLKTEENNLVEERFWRHWADHYFVHVLSPNVYRTMGESLETFHHFSKVGRWDEYFPTWERLFCVYIGAFVMYFVGKRLKKKHALKEQVRESLYDTCRQWMKAVGKNRKFMGGEQPNLADLAIYGALSSIEGCTAFKDLLTNVNIGPWYYSVKELCEAHAGAKTIS